MGLSWFNDNNAFLINYSCSYSWQSCEVFRVNGIDLISKECEREQALTVSERRV